VSTETDEGQDDEPPTDHYDLNVDAFGDALKMSNLLLSQPVRTGKPGEVELFLGMFCYRLAHSSDAIILAKIARIHRLTPPRISLVILVFTTAFFRRNFSLNEVLAAAVGFNPPETQRLYDWAVQSPLFEVSWDGSGLRLSRTIVSALLGGPCLTEHDATRFRKVLADLPVTTRSDIPDNQPTTEEEG
jgi:hypothetical protein